MFTDYPKTHQIPIHPVAQTPRRPTNRYSNWHYASNYSNATKAG